MVAVVNERSELLMVDSMTGAVRVADFSSQEDGISSLAWSPCGKWLAYSYVPVPHMACLKVLSATSGRTHKLTTPAFWDDCPTWDPDGRYVYFLSSREYEPVYDELQVKNRKEELANCDATDGLAANNTIPLGDFSSYGGFDVCVEARNL
eukprot:4453955-Pyramimonas_sp.AAC.1